MAAREDKTVEQGVSSHYDSTKAAMLRATKEPSVARDRLRRFCSIGDEKTNHDPNGSCLFAAGLPADIVGSQNFKHFSTRQTTHLGDW